MEKAPALSLSLIEGQREKVKEKGERSKVKELSSDSR